jgi:hypothetical protein
MFIDRLIESNPQLFRELKSRLKPESIGISVAISLSGQILSLMAFGNHLTDLTPREWQSWFWINFMWLSGVGIFALLVPGTYLLISDLSQEQEKGTLNVLRLTPQSAKNILIGKLLGVPILLYIVVLLALPLHIFSGLAAGISLISILGFYAVLISSCIFFYSLALLFALFPIGKGNVGNVKAGLFGLILTFALFINSTLTAGSSFTASSPFNWIACFTPWAFVQASIVSQKYFDYDGIAANMIWYNLPIAKSAIAMAIFLIVNYSLWTFWIWQGLQCSFHNPTANLLTKGQSYWLTAGWQLTILGFVANSQSQPTREIFWGNFCILMAFDLVLCFVLISTLTPHRQAIQDWARYRHYYKFGGKGKLWQDLLLGEKSPGVVAIALNAVLASLILIPWILKSGQEGFTILALTTLLIAIALTSIYALVVQLMSLVRSQRRVFLTAISLIGLIFLPPVFSVINYTSFDRTAWIWLFSIFPWVGLSGVAIAPVAVISACIVQWLGVTILGMQLHHRIKAMGASKLLTAA